MLLDPPDSPADFRIVAHRHDDVAGVVVIKNIMIESAIRLSWRLSNVEWQSFIEPMPGPSARAATS
jgi:hypothetical protein